MSQPSANSPAAGSAQPASRRRTLALSGCVNFPVNDPAYKNSREGGMVVKLVVVDDREHAQSDWTVCCGAQVHDLITEVLVGDDQAPKPPLWPEINAEWTDRSSLDKQAEAVAWVRRHYPRYMDNSADALEGELSRHYLAAVVLGATGWSGYDEAGGDYFICRHEHLTDQGKALYAQMQALYPGCTLHLLTFVDT